MIRRNLHLGNEFHLALLTTFLHMGFENSCFVRKQSLQQIKIIRSSTGCILPLLNLWDQLCLIERISPASLTLHSYLTIEVLLEELPALECISLLFTNADKIAYVFHLLTFSNVTVFSSTEHHQM